VAVAPRLVVVVPRLVAVAVVLAARVSEALATKTLTVAKERRKGQGGNWSSFW
jgi:hypothetical protein